MRVKSMPRHLPRKDSMQSLSRVKNASTNLEFFSTIKLEEAGSVSVRTVNFTNYQDIVQEMDLAVRKQNIIPQNKFEQWKPFSGDAKTEAVDLTMRNEDVPAIAGPSSSNQANKFKDTYLYQIMTDPNFLKKIIRDKQASKSSCPYCKEEFGSELEVKKHLNVQADEANQLTCCACGKSFAQKRYLRYHQRCHSERNKFACDICTRKYSRQDNLTRHNIFHTNPDKFPCGSCERTFARKDLLNKHLKCHENKYKYHCDVCQKYFKGPISLENHTRLFHSGSESSSESFASLGACSSSVSKSN